MYIYIYILLYKNFRVSLRDITSFQPNEFSMRRWKNTSSFPFQVPIFDTHAILSTIVIKSNYRWRIPTPPLNIRIMAGKKLKKIATFNLRWFVRRIIDITNWKKSDEIFTKSLKIDCRYGTHLYRTICKMNVKNKRPSAAPIRYQLVAPFVPYIVIPLYFINCHQSYPNEINFGVKRFWFIN